MAVSPSPDAQLVRDFLNTRDHRTFAPRGHAARDGTADDIATPHTLASWLVDHELLPERTPLRRAAHERLLALRTTLRACVEPDTAARLPALQVPVRAVIDPREGPRLVLDGPASDRAVGAIGAAALRLQLAGDWWRLRACAADDCRWVFFDESRPGRGRYCSPEYCGNRVKTRAYRQRRGRHRSSVRHHESASQ